MRLHFSIGRQLAVGFQIDQRERRCHVGAEAIGSGARILSRILVVLINKPWVRGGVKKPQLPATTVRRAQGGRWWVHKSNIKISLFVSFPIGLAKMVCAPLRGETIAWTSSD